VEKSITLLYKQNPAVETAPLGPGLMLLEPKSRKFCALNATSSWIWTHLQEPTSAKQLAKKIVDYCQGVTEPDALNDVHAIIEELTKLGMVVQVVQ